MRLSSRDLEKKVRKVWVMWLSTFSLANFFALLNSMFCSFVPPTWIIQIFLISILFEKWPHGGSSQSVAYMFSAVCASSVYSRVCMKLSSFLFVRPSVMPRMVYLSCGNPFPVKHQLRSGCHVGRSSKKTSGKFLRGGYGGDVFEG